ncbi:MAG: ethanolamine utilization protein EutP [Arachnia propionica]|nr:MAG: ethanolamine utilization protein EutP [Arachnia propionica]
MTAGSAARRGPPRMKKTMLVGGVGDGKTTFRQQLLGQEIRYAKTQTMDVDQGILDTPGEYLEHVRFQRALQVASYDVELIVLLLEATRDHCRIPPNYAAAFNADIIGVVTKIDLATSTQIADAEGQLWQAGARAVFHVNCHNGAGFEKVRRELWAS